MIANRPGQYQNIAFGVSPGRVGSLWEMFELNAGAFYAAVTQVRHIVTYIDAKGINEKTVGGDDTTDTFFAALCGHCRKLNEHLDVLGATVTKIASEEAISAFSGRYKQTGEDIRSRFEDIDRTLRRELRQKKLLILTPSEQGWLEPQAPLFGEAFTLKFPSAGVFELDEAAKCLAFGRSTASVFHFMRLMEIGIKALLACLSIPDPVKPAERNWAVILRKIKEDAVDVKWPDAKAKMAPECVLFESLHASLDAVKNPWRNATMHVENKYTPEEAEHIFYAVRGFMKKLADRMDENGDPKA